MTNLATPCHVSTSPSDSLAACYCPCCGLSTIEQFRRLDYVCQGCGIQFSILSRDPILSSGPLQIDRAARKVRMRGVEVSVTANEFRLLDFLMSHSGIILERDRLVGAVWGDDHSIAHHSVNVIVLRLRKK